MYTIEKGLFTWIWGLGCLNVVIQMQMLFIQSVYFLLHQEMQLSAMWLRSIPYLPGWNASKLTDTILHVPQESNRNNLRIPICICWNCVIVDCSIISQSYCCHFHGRVGIQRAMSLFSYVGKAPMKISSKAINQLRYVFYETTVH